jgi:hypothetical protein
MFTWTARSLMPVPRRLGAAELVDQVVLVRVVLREPHLAGTGELVEVLVLHRCQVEAVL